MVRIRIGVAVEAGRVAAVAVRRKRVLWAAEASYADADDLGSALAGLASERPRGARRADVLLAESVAHTREVTGLPRLKRDDLTAHVQLHSKRYFLQNGIPLVTDAYPSRHRSVGSPTAHMAAALLPVVEAITAGLSAGGLVLGSMGPAPEGLENRVPDCLSGRDTVYLLAYAAARGAETPFSLLPQPLRQRDATALRRSVRSWGIAVATSGLLLGSAWIGGALTRQRRALDELARMSASSNSALAVRRDLDAATEAVFVMARAEDRKHHRLRFLADVTRSLPDSAFLVNLRLEAGSGVLSGYARRAADVLARLEQTNVASRLAMDGAVTREVVGGREWERFTIRFEVVQ